MPLRALNNATQTFDSSSQKLLEIYYEGALFYSGWKYNVCTVGCNFSVKNQRHFLFVTFHSRGYFPCRRVCDEIQSANPVYLFYLLIHSLVYVVR
jgi:hypothetical protein